MGEQERSRFPRQGFRENYFLSAASLSTFKQLLVVGVSFLLSGEWFSRPQQATRKQRYNLGHRRESDSSEHMPATFGHSVF